MAGASDSAPGPAEGPSGARQNAAAGNTPHPVTGPYQRFSGGSVNPDKRWYVKVMRRQGSPPRGDLHADHELNQYVLDDTQVDDYFEAVRDLETMSDEQKEQLEEALKKLAKQERRVKGKQLAPAKPKKRPKR